MKRAPAPGPVALKMAMLPWDPRFMREVGLLSLVHHPSIPRLPGHGFWQHPSGAFFPFIVMEWVEGTPLYEWAQEHNPTNQEQRSTSSSGGCTSPNLGGRAWAGVWPEGLHGLSIGLAHSPGAPVSGPPWPLGTLYRPPIRPMRTHRIP